MTDLDDTLAALRATGEQLQRYGETRAFDVEVTWDELLDAYDTLLERAAGMAGLEIPAPPEILERRFSRDDRERLVAALRAAGHPVDLTG
jgi:hypothetical protein